MRFLFLLFFISSVFAADIPATHSEWRLSGGSGSVQIDASTSKSCLVLHGEDGQPETFHWRLNYEFQPGEIYQLSVNIKRTHGSPDGVVLFGTDFCNLDVRPQQEWQKFELIFQVPKSGKHYIRFGKWNNNAEIWFSDVQLIRVKALSPALGKSESIQNAQYAANFSFRHLAGNYQRCLYDFNAYFNTNRWDFRGNQFLIYRHDVGAQQSRAKLLLKTLYAKLGLLQVQVSTDAQQWQHIAYIRENGIHEFDLPAEFYPSQTIYIKLHNLNPVGRIQIDEYQYSAALSGQTSAKIGKAQLMSVEHSTMLSRGSILHDENYGRYLFAGKGMQFWWTENARNVSKTRALPRERSRGIEISLAKNEYEAAQLVLYSHQDVDAKIQAGEFKNASGETLPSAAIQLYRVGYVFVKSPTDRLGEIGDWPDPLHPLENKLSLKAKENQPIWIDVHIPAEQPAGIYRGSIKVSYSNEQAKIPVIITVWDFAVPEEKHVDAAIGFDFWSARRYHHIGDSDTDMLKLCDAYFKNFAEHRISPYDPFVLYPIDVTFNAESLQAEIDFSKFDRGVQKYIREFGFNRFRFHFPWLGYGVIKAEKGEKTVTVHRGSTAYEKLAGDYLTKLEQHLKDLDILEKAYVYWKDEPETNEYDFVCDGMQFIKKYAPGLTRMLTEQPEDELFGCVDLWCPVTMKFQPEIVKQRQALGEDFWWYVCSSPREPYATLFIDHHALELRLWLWQSWQYDIKGVLIWHNNYWTSNLAFPPPQRQNPYEDTMSYVSGYGKPIGTVQYWGNGDGRLIYPPLEVFQSDAPNTQGPVNSIRWEMLRDGLEDYEYLWLLQSLIRSAKDKGVAKAIIHEAEELLTIPDEISTHLTSFTTDPTVLLQHRRRMAEMIVKLQNVL